FEAADQSDVAVLARRHTVGVAALRAGLAAGGVLDVVVDERAAVLLRRLPADDECVRLGMHTHMPGRRRPQQVGHAGSVAETGIAKAVDCDDPERVAPARLDVVLPEMSPRG